MRQREGGRRERVWRLSVEVEGRRMLSEGARTGRRELLG
jgi:hypothetical protein